MSIESVKLYEARKHIKELFLKTSGGTDDPTLDILSFTENNNNVESKDICLESGSIRIALNEETTSEEMNFIRGEIKDTLSYYIKNHSNELNADAETLSSILTIVDAGLFCDSMFIGKTIIFNI